MDLTNTPAGRSGKGTSVRKSATAASGRETPGNVISADDPLMTINETAEYLRVHRDTVGKLMANGMLPYVLVGQRRRVRQSDVLAYVNAGG
jgi:excisionase family DNA binding protein